MVHLAIDLSEVTTKATLADAFLVALQRLKQNSKAGQIKAFAGSATQQRSSNSTSNGLDAQMQ
jgi:hypothetical protein